MVVPQLQWIFYVCLEYLYVHAIQRNTKVVFIPRLSISIANDLRAFSLTFMFFKTMEKILYLEIRSNRFPALASSAQPALRAGLLRMYRSLWWETLRKLWPTNFTHWQLLLTWTLNKCNVNVIMTKFFTKLFTKRIINASIVHKTHNSHHCCRTSWQKNCQRNWFRFVHSLSLRFNQAQKLGFLSGGIEYLFLTY